MCLFKTPEQIWDGDPKCDHDWHMEPPTMSVGGVFQEWDGPIYDYCSKCGAKRKHPECNHKWRRTKEVRFSRMIINGERFVETKHCTKCGTQHFSSPDFFYKLFHCRQLRAIAKESDKKL